MNCTPFKDDWKSALQWILSQNGESKSGVARAIGLDQSSVSRYLAGKTTPKEENQRKILRHAEDLGWNGGSPANEGPVGAANPDASPSIPGFGTSNVTFDLRDKVEERVELNPDQLRSCVSFSRTGSRGWAFSAA